MGKASFRADFKVSATVGKAAEGPDSLAALNDIIVNTTPDMLASYTDEEKMQKFWIPMKRLCAACATQRKLLTPGACKVRGDPDDFLNYATAEYIVRWKKQFEPAVKRRPVNYVQNWIPYMLNTIRFFLITYNKEVFDYDFLPLPLLYTDIETDEGTERDIPDPYEDRIFITVAINELKDPRNLHRILMGLPEELRAYAFDTMYYIRTNGLLISESSRNFVKICERVFRKEVTEWIQ